MMNRLFRKKGGFTLIELMIVVAIIGILAAIAIPNFIRFQAKSKQSEAKTNLKAIFTAQKSYFGEKDKYSSDFTVIGFDPEPANRYSYGLVAGCSEIAASNARTNANKGCIGQDSAKFPTAPTAANAISSLGVQPSAAACPSCFFSANAIGNVDNDAAGDVWGITASPTGETLALNCGIDTTRIAAGEPGNAYNDVSCQ
ncbi:prepilin-type N-terminal cleavage/methylation domain-containing protein [Corallococcus sicarius]|uniref:Prepilin-type N-terminal cleavage/methylation domain-containing protein n=1 Tax=Corallococcus sicarius TaxID=2316726 RepID=A0A3A8NHG7_9BACT|nr:prepilin-type N-terminal cleavage/methylation domain-containing protein [Corallococcus sicarius]RKH43836.1 prepilin-type N-terminal cleavage/methylation domain-containing protein [Corallococcus sicarius]